MVRGCATIYKTSRHNTQLTQEQAAELLSVSVDSLKNYEGGRCRPPEDVVLRMVRIYEDRPLGYEHLRSTPLGMEILPALGAESLEAAALKYQQAMNRARDMDDKLIDIACDGKVDGSESRVWSNICGTITSTVGALLSLTMIKTKKSRQRGNADSSEGKSINKITIPRLRRPIKGARA